MTRRKSSRRKIHTATGLNQLATAIASTGAIGPFAGYFLGAASVKPDLPVLLAIGAVLLVIAFFVHKTGFDLLGEIA